MSSSSSAVPNPNPLISNLSIRPVVEPDLSVFKLALTAKGGQPILITSADNDVLQTQLGYLCGNGETRDMIDHGHKIQKFLLSDSSILFDNGKKVYFRSDAGPIREIRNLYKTAIDPDGKRTFNWKQRSEGGLRGTTLSGTGVPNFADGYVQTPFTAQDRNAVHASISTALQLKSRKQQTALDRFFTALELKVGDVKALASPAARTNLENAMDRLAHLKHDLVNEVLARPIATQNYVDLKRAQEAFEQSLRSRMPLDPNKWFNTFFNRTVDTTPQLENSIKILSVRMALARITDRQVYDDMKRRLSTALRIEIPEATDSMEEAFILLATSIEEGNAQNIERFSNQIMELFPADCRPEIKDHMDEVVNTTIRPNIAFMT